MLGIGVGVMLARRSEGSLRRRLAHVDSQLRTSVLPVLERHAETLGIPPDKKRAQSTEDGADASIRLATTIRDHEDSQELPYSDTLEVDRAELARISREGGG